MVMMVDSLYMRGEYYSALDSCDQWIDFCKQEYGAEGIEVWDARSFKALILMMNSQYEESLKLHEWILKEVDPVIDEDHQIVYAATLSNYGELLKNQGEVLKALDVMLRVVSMDSTMGYQNDGAHAEVLNNIGVVHEALGDPTTALEYLERSVPITWPENLPYRYANMAENYRQLGDIRQALTLFEKAEKLFLKHWGEDSPETINCQVNYASLRLSMGDYSTVIDDLTTIEQRLRKNSQIDATHEVRIRIQRHISLALIGAGQFDLAGTYVNRYLETSRALYRDRPDFIQMAELLKVRYLESLGQESEADQLITRLYHNLSGESEFFTFQVELLEEYINIKARTDQFDMAVAVQQDLIRQLKDQYGPYSLMLLRNEHRLSGMMYGHGYVEESKRLNLRIMQSLIYQSSFIYPYLSDNGKLQFKKQTRPIVDFLSGTAVGSFSTDENYMERFTELHLNYKALTLVYSAANLMRAGTSKEFDTWYEVRQEIEKAYLQPGGGKVKLDSLIARSNELERTLSTGRSQDFDKLTYQSFKKSISPEEIIIQFISWKDSNEIDHYAALIDQETGSGKLVSIDSLPRTEMEWEAANMYQYLWEKLEPYLPPRPDLVIVPEGLFHRVFFYSIYLPESGKYLYQQYNVRIIPDIRYMNRRSVNDNDILSNKIALFGNPTYDGGLPASATTGIGTALSELPSTAKEVHALHDIFISAGWFSEVYERESSSKANFSKMETNDLSVLHIASHGSYRPPGAQIERTSKINAIDYPAINPMFHSAIYLSDTHPDSTSSTGSGYLSAYEISNMRFDRLELATLSACESGLGLVHTGEGVFGLQRGFLMAGARNIISTLAEIPDAATVEFMQTFYTGLTGGQSIFDSFKNTQEFMSDRYPPEVWGAFVLIGRGDSVLTSGGYSWNGILLLISIGCLIVLAYLLRSRINLRAGDDLK